MKKFQKMIGFMCMIAMLVCLTACGSSSGSQETDGKPDTPETTVPQQEETDESLDTGAVQPTGEQDAPVAEPADTEETVEQNIVREEFGYLIVGKKNSLSVFLFYPCLKEIVELY